MGEASNPERGKPGMKTQGPVKLYLSGRDPVDGKVVDEQTESLSEPAKHKKIARVVMVGDTATIRITDGVVCRTTGAGAQSPKDQVSIRVIRSSCKT